MTIIHILVFAFGALPFMWLVPARWRPWGLLIASVLAMGWLQDGEYADGIDLLLPVATLLLTVAVWWVIQPLPSSQEAVVQRHRDNQWALGLLVGGLALLWGADLVLVGRSPSLELTLSTVGIVSVVTIGFARLLPARLMNESQLEVYKRAAVWLIGLIILVLVVIKVPALARFVGRVLEQETLAEAGDVSLFAWLGFSYIAFRLIGTLLDFRAGRLPKEGFSLRDMATYVLFFPAFTAGPIDQARRFIPELKETKGLDAGSLVEGGGRIAVGVFKKFVIADSLALVAMSPVLIDRTETTAGLWLLVYLYTFQIFLDFSGYSDVAIGIGKLYGIKLPENFDRPYLQQNIQQFWQRWHMTLSNWFRIYFFTPFSRAMLTSKFKIPQTVIVLVAQVSTMLLIGLWHGATLNFALWGLWHGAGLYLNKLWADRTRRWYRRQIQSTWKRRLIYVGGVLLTFHFVALGWVFFALPEPADSFDMLRGLFGI
jgi:D-alanyl-lipoteichoic acid acyltransferase DltB (MBOAT superfamily)